MNSIMKAEIEKIRKEYPRRTKKLLKRKALGRKSHQRDKHLDSFPCKILPTIPKMDEGRTQINGPKDKKIDDYKKGFTSER